MFPAPDPEGAENTHMCVREEVSPAKKLLGRQAHHSKLIGHVGVGGLKLHPPCWRAAPLDWRRRTYHGPAPGSSSQAYIPYKLLCFHRISPGFCHCTIGTNCVSLVTRVPHLPRLP